MVPSRCGLGGFETNTRGVGGPSTLAIFGGIKRRDPRGADYTRNAATLVDAWLLPNGRSMLQQLLLRLH